VTRDPGDHVQTISGALGTVGLSAPGELGNTTLVSLYADHSSRPRRHARSVAAVQRADAALAGRALRRPCSMASRGRQDQPDV